MQANSFISPTQYNIYIHNIYNYISVFITYQTQTRTCQFSKASGILQMSTMSVRSRTWLSIHHRHKTKMVLPFSLPNQSITQCDLQARCARVNCSSLIQGFNSSLGFFSGGHGTLHVLSHLNIFHIFFNVNDATIKFVHDSHRKFRQDWRVHILWSELWKHFEG